MNRMLYGIPERFLLSVAITHSSPVLVAPVDPAMGRDLLTRSWKLKVAIKGDIFQCSHFGGCLSPVYVQLTALNILH